MPLKAVLKSLEGLPEEIQALYREEDGQFYLDLDTESLKGHAATKPLESALKRVREEREGLKTQLAETVAKFEGIDPEKAREAQAKLDELEDKELLDAGNIEELLTTRTERMRSDMQAQMDAKDKALEEIKGELATATGKLSELRIYGEVERVALEQGARKSALDDIRNRARSVFRLEGDDVLAYKPGTEDVMYGKEGDPLTMSEWVTGLSAEAAHLFEENRGGGAQGGSGDQGRQAQGGVRVIPRSSAGSNIEAIAKGEAVLAE